MSGWGQSNSIVQFGQEIVSRVAAVLRSASASSYRLAQLVSGIAQRKPLRHGTVLADAPVVIAAPPLGNEHLQVELLLVGI